MIDMDTHAGETSFLQNHRPDRENRAIPSSGRSADKSRGNPIPADKDCGASGRNCGIDLDAIAREIEAGYINRTKHPTADLFIYNYSPRAQWEQHWTPETMMCRGLILDGKGSIVARPFPKFFNYEQVLDQIPNEPFEVFDKLDGSLGILYFDGERFAIATRGSFTSPQAVEATKMLYERMADSPDAYNFVHDCAAFGVTALFEIIYPQNRIVVDYGTRREIVLLAGVVRTSGEELAEINPPPQWDGFPIVKRFDGMTDIEAIKNTHRDNAEGFVLRFASGFRCKVKLAEYVRLHKLLTGITPRHIWEELKAGRGVATLADRVPDEFYQWVNNVAAKLSDDYATIEGECQILHLSDFPDRRTAAAYITKQKYPSILFSMLDGKPYADAIWKLIKPTASKAFRCDE